MTIADFSFDQLATAAEREVRFRERVYVRQVELNRMSRAKADVEIALMKAIACHLREQAQRDGLFGLAPGSAAQVSIVSRAATAKAGEAEDPA
jgi:hypothetical protein